MPLEVCINDSPDPAYLQPTVLLSNACPCPTASVSQELPSFGPCLACLGGMCGYSQAQIPTMPCPQHHMEGLPARPSQGPGLQVPWCHWCLGCSPCPIPPMSHSPMLPALLTGPPDSSQHFWRGLCGRGSLPHPATITATGRAQPNTGCSAVPCQLRGN